MGLRNGSKMEGRPFGSECWPWGFGGLVSAAVASNWVEIQVPALRQPSSVFRVSILAGVG